MKKFVFLCIAYCFTFSSPHLTAEEPASNKAHTVIVILQAKQGSAHLVKESLTKVAELSRLEKSCIAYHFYQDKDNPTRFALYEQWTSKELHEQQFAKPYIIDFAKQAEAWLDQPYDVILGQEVSL